MKTIHVEKNPDVEQAVPTEWRATLKTIADAFVEGRKPMGPGIGDVDTQTLEISQKSITDYPDSFGELSAESWKTSVYLWMDGYWQVLVDLSNSDGETSDLVLHVQVFPEGGGYLFQPGLVYVP